MQQNGSDAPSYAMLRSLLKLHFVLLLTREALKLASSSVKATVKDRQDRVRS